MPRLARRGLLSAASTPPKTIVQTFAVDEFGELPARKRAASTTARRDGHALGPWHRRKNDPAGRWDTFCSRCGKTLVVCTEAPDGLPDAYGHALTERCGS
jgi:hypothetical protein